MAPQTVSLDISKLQTSIPILDNDITHIEEVYFAAGSYGEVYRAILKSPNGELHEVAVKDFRSVYVISEEIQKHINRIDRELRVWADLEHRNVLKLMGILANGRGKVSPGALVSMYRPHRDAKTFIDEHPDSDRMCIIKGVAEALRYLHSKDVVHGDLKARNVLIHVEETEIIPEVADFGRSRVLERKGDTTLLRTSCRFTAPEVLLHENDNTTAFSKAGDIYSFGMFMLEILTGKTPFYCISSDPRIVVNVCGGIRPSRNKYPSDHITDHRWEIMEKCWNVNPDDRGTMQDIMSLLNVA
ncbi:kinase-like domain-containing protein [Cyathus striatus]|nr:kinase-like domain-containing protein [Cyathus striatus]